MLIVDRLLVSGIKFVLGKIAAAVDEELNDVERLREELLALQMRFELGEVPKAEFEQVEGALLARIREVQEQRTGGQAISPLDGKLTGVEASFGGDDDQR
jgi:hypothetical protein